MRARLLLAFKAGYEAALARPRAGRETRAKRDADPNTKQAPPLRLPAAAAGPETANRETGSAPPDRAKQQIGMNALRIVRRLRAEETSNSVVLGMGPAPHGTSTKTK